MVERHVPNVHVAGPIPVTRSEQVVSRTLFERTNLRPMLRPRKGILSVTTELMPYHEIPPMCSLSYWPHKASDRILTDPVVNRN